MKTINTIAAAFAIAVFIACLLSGCTLSDPPSRVQQVVDGARPIIFPPIGGAQ